MAIIPSGTQHPEQINNNNFVLLEKLYNSGHLCHGGPHLYVDYWNLYVNPSNGRIYYEMATGGSSTAYADEHGGKAHGDWTYGDVNLWMGWTLFLHNKPTSDSAQAKYCTRATKSNGKWDVKLDFGSSGTYHAITYNGKDGSGDASDSSKPCPKIHVTWNVSDSSKKNFREPNNPTVKFHTKEDGGFSAYDYGYDSIFFYCSYDACSLYYNDHQDENDNTNYHVSIHGSQYCHETYGWNVTGMSSAYHMPPHVDRCKKLWNAPPSDACTISLANPLSSDYTLGTGVSNSTSTINVNVASKETNFMKPITKITVNTSGASKNTGWKSAPIVGTSSFSFTSLSAATSYAFSVVAENRSDSTASGSGTYRTRYAGATLSVSNVKAQVTTATFDWSATYALRQISWKVTAASNQSEVGKTGTISYEVNYGQSSEVKTYIKGLIPNVQYTVELTPMNCKNYDSTTGGVVQIQFKTVEPAKIVSISNANFGEDLTFEFRRTCDERVRIEFVVSNTSQTTETVASGTYSPDDSDYTVIPKNNNNFNYTIPFFSKMDNYQGLLDSMYKIFKWGGTLQVSFTTYTFLNDGSNVTTGMPSGPITLTLTGIMKTVRAGFPVNDPIQKDPIPTRRCMVWLGDALGKAHRCVTWINPTDTKGDANTHRTI